MLFLDSNLYGLKEFLQKEEKAIYCFGAGKAFYSFFNEFKEYNLLNRVKAIADNHYNKENYAIRNIHNTAIPIISVEQMVQSISPRNIILITASDSQEIVSQLEQIDKLKNIKYCIYFMLRIRQNDFKRLQIPVPKKISVYPEKRIPKIIHYCWFGGKPIPECYQLWMESWRKYCPDYEIIEWNEKNYDVKKNKYIRQAYEMKRWAFVSDYARIDVINKYGGIYLDTDVELIKSIDELLMNDAFCGFESNQYVAYGLGFGATKQHPIVNEIKEYYDNTSFVLEDGILNQVNCPVIQTRIMEKHGLICNGEYQIVGGMTVYPSRVLCGMSPYSFRIQRDLEYTYAIHHYSASWLEDKREKNNIICYMKKFGKDDTYYCPDYV